mgnify:CR=1 FL=1|tara:strand:- start:923 stop:1531 length:609 start_codon:yes stop_codon:yes gene_type:complete
MVEFLQQKALDIEGVRILGCTLWTDIPTDQRIYKSIWGRMNDYRCIVKKIDEGDREREEAAILEWGSDISPEQRQKIVDNTLKRGDRGLEPQDTRRWHKSDVLWLEAEAKKAADLDLPVVVLTHHSPVPCAETNLEFLSNPVTFACATDLRHLFRDPVRVWAYGHTHVKYDKRQGQTRVLSNARGYVHNLVGDYDPELIVEV